MDVNSPTSFEFAKAKIIAVVSALIPEAKIYLFGSRAKGTHGEWSDIDIALDAGASLPFEKVGEVKEVMAALSIPFKVDVVDIYQVTELMRQLIIKEKIAWKL